MHAISIFAFSEHVMADNKLDHLFVSNRSRLAKHLQSKARRHWAYWGWAPALQR